MGVLPGEAWKHLVNGNGIPSLACVPYVSGDGSVPPCPTSCTSHSTSNSNTRRVGDTLGNMPFTLYKAGNYSHVGSFVDAKAHIEAIKQAILRGPVDATFNVFKAFDAYPAKGLVYDQCDLKDGGGYEGMHSITIVGWDNNAFGLGPAWKVSNSWGADWGPLNGYFWIRMGVDCAGIESLVYEGFPAL